MKLEAVGRLAGGVAHDFNNLLTTVVGYASLARLSIEPASPVAPMLAEIQRAAESGAQLTQQLLAFSRKQVVSPKELDWNEGVGEMSEMLGPLLGEPVGLRLELEPGLWPVFADRSQCQQVLVNLAANARDAMPDGGVVTIRTRNAPAGTPVPPGRRWADDLLGGPIGPVERDEVWVSVGDDGVGMDEATLGRIFEPFFTTKPRGQGTGLGLPMAHGAVHQHGGTLNVASALGQGTTVTLRYPRSAGDGALPGPLGPVDLSADGAIILVVEDEPLVREMVARVLEQLGYHVIACRSGEQAIDVCARPDTRVDLVVTDVVMPGMSGPVLAQKLRAARPDLPVLFTSGHGEEVVSKHGIATGGVHFLPKPYAPKDLAQKIREILDAR
jgi:CheY-like chemotaxis protein